MEVLQPMTPREMLIRLLDHLGDLTRSDATPPEIIRDARLKIRSALSAHKYACYKRVIEEMEAGLASTIRRTIERLEGLGQVVYSDLLKIINETHPELTVKPTVDPWENEGIIFSTEQGMARRKEQLDHLVNVKMPANAKAIGEAAARGDLSENSEYKFALEERDLLRARVAMIQNELNLARIITVHDVDTDQVNIGTHLCLQSTDGANRREMTILGPWEADMEKNIYNYRAPMCMKFRGLKVGDRVTLNLDDTEREYQIESIANALIDKPAD